MNRIDRVFQRAREEGRAVLVPFVTCGDPDLETTTELVPELVAAGADIVELGVPHSDPIAEGPVIQAGSLRALRHGVTLAQVLDLCGRLRRSVEVPLVLMGYLNNVRAFGERALVEAAAEAGVDGLIVADAPYEEARELQAACDETKSVHRILLVAPTTTPERMVQIARRSRGFVYCVSVTGVTGERAELEDDLEALVRRIQRVTSTPVAVGFGISSARHAAQVARLADGVIVGSALVRRIGEAPSRAAAIASVSGFVGELAAAVRGAR